jgi:hypothetical protein
MSRIDEKSQLWARSALIQEKSATGLLPDLAEDGVKRIVER